MTRDLRRRSVSAAGVGRSLAVVRMLLASPLGAATQQRWEPAPTGEVPLSVDEAVRRALSESQEVELAESRVAVAREQVAETRAAALPQVNASLGYTRTLASVFESGAPLELPDSLRFEPDSTRPLGERVSYLEDRVPAAALGSLGTLFGNLPFGQGNAYALTVSGSQLLYSGGAWDRRSTSRRTSSMPAGST